MFSLESQNYVLFIFIKMVTGILKPHTCFFDQPSTLVFHRLKLFLFLQEFAGCFGRYCFTTVILLIRVLYYDR